MLCSRNPTQSEECLEFTCGSTPYFPSPSPLFSVCFWLSALDYGLLPSPAFDVCLCHWVQTCSSSSLQLFEVFVFVSLPKAVFYLFIVRMLNVL